MSKHPLLSILVLSSALATATLPARHAEAKVSVGDVVSALKTAYWAYDNFIAGGLTLEQATDQTLSAIDAAKTEILNHMDELATADKVACVRHVLIGFGDIEWLSFDSRQALASDAVACLAEIESLLDAVQSKEAVDTLGFALNALGPVALLARAHADLPESVAVSDMIINSNWTVIARLHPRCYSTTLSRDSSGSFTELMVRCIAYNKDTGVALSWVGDPDLDDKKVAAEDAATRNTSRAVAQQLLPEIPVPEPVPFRLGGIRLR